MAEYFFNKLNVKKAAIIHDIGANTPKGSRNTSSRPSRRRRRDRRRRGVPERRCRLPRADHEPQEERRRGDRAAPALQGNGAHHQADRRDGVETLLYRRRRIQPEYVRDLRRRDGGLLGLPPEPGRSDPLTPLKEKFKKRFNAEPTEIVNTVAAYDLIQWVADSIERAGKAEGPAVRDAIESAKDLKLLHFTLTLDKATHNPLNKPAAILRQEGRAQVPRDVSTADGF